MELSNRLQAVANMVTKGNSVADIGCDHGYVSIYLMTNKIAPKVIAMDVNKGPLERAKEHILEQGFQEDIEIRLSDGGKALQLKTGRGYQVDELEVDTIIIAGMGGRLIQKILQDSMDKIKLAKEIILQPQSDIEQVRRFLTAQGFLIIEETMIFEEGKYYPMMKAIVSLEQSNCEVVHKPEEEILFYKYGPLLLQNKNLVLHQYLEMEEDKLKKIISHLETLDLLPEGTMIRLEELKQELKTVQQALSY